MSNPENQTMSSDLLWDNRYILLALQSNNKKLIRDILKNADTKLIHTICEIIHNILKGNVELTSDVKDTLERYKKQLRCLTSTKAKGISKKRKLIQKGAGYIPLLIGSVLSGLTKTLADNILS